MDLQIIMRFSVTYSTQESVTVQDNPAYSGVVNELIKLQENPANGSASKKLKYDNLL